MAKSKKKSLPSIVDSYEDLQILCEEFAKRGHKITPTGAWDAIAERFIRKNNARHYWKLLRFNWYLTQRMKDIGASVKNNESVAKREFASEFCECDLRKYKSDTQSRQHPCVPCPLARKTARYEAAPHRCNLRRHYEAAPRRGSRALQVTQRRGRSTVVLVLVDCVMSYLSIWKFVTSANFIATGDTNSQLVFLINRTGGLYAWENLDRGR